MTKEMLQRIKEFAEENWCADENHQIYVDDPEFAVTNPWIDRSGRFPLTDEGAVKEWGLDVVLSFCEKAIKEINRNKVDDPLCGFVWCHGNKDFSVWEVSLPYEVREEIESIIAPYACEGTSVRNAWDSNFSEVFNEEY